MPQRISDYDMECKSVEAEHRVAMNVASPQDLVLLDLRDARQALKIAVGALSYYAMHDQDNTIARTALDRIKGITDATTNK